MSLPKSFNKLSRRQFVTLSAGTLLGASGISTSLACSTLAKIQNELKTHQEGNDLSCLQKTMPDTSSAVESIHNSAIPGFYQFCFPKDKESGRLIFTIGDKGHPVLLLHELPGLTPACADFACRLAIQGFKVYVPLLFGDPLQDSHLETFLSSVGLAVGSDFCLFAEDAHHPIIDWLDGLCNEILIRERDKPLGVIGMCLTGNLPIALLKHDNVKAIVLSQPGLPLYIPWFPNDSKKHALGLTNEQVKLAENRLKIENDYLEILAFRFTNDCICPPERFNTLKSKFGSRLKCFEIQSPNHSYGIEENAHAVLSTEFRDTPNHPTNIAFLKVVDYLHKMLA